MKKQFFRVKQLADQTFLKAEKSEIFNHEELQIADQKVEYLRAALTAITKKITPSGPTTDIDKLMKKAPEYQLGSTFLEESKQARECPLFQQVLRDCGQVEQTLAREYAEHELKVEELVFAPLQNILENEFPSILKHKNHLKKYCLDKDSASNRYLSTGKEALRDDMEEADSKVEQSRDQLAIEMFNILSKENEISEYILQLLKVQRSYHENAFKSLQALIPQMEKKIGDSPVRRVFGTSLQEHLRITGKRIAYPLEICITALSEYSMSEEGLFRVAGSSSKVKRLKAAIDSGCLSDFIPEYRDAHTLASLLKLYLRELPEPLLTFHLHKDWIEAAQIPESRRLTVVREIISKLPQENRDNLSYLFQFLSKLTKHPENKMTPSNIAIVLSPNLLWDKHENINVNIGNSLTINVLVELLIKESETLFPEDATKYVTLDIIQMEDAASSNTKASCNNLDACADSPKPSQRKKKSAPVPPIVAKGRLDDVPPHKSAQPSSISPQAAKKSAKVLVTTSPTSQLKNPSGTLPRPAETPKKPLSTKDNTLNNTSKGIVANNKSDRATMTDTVNNVVNKVEQRYTTSVVHKITQPQSVITDSEAAAVKKTQTQSDSSEESMLRRKDPSTKPEIPARPSSLTVRSGADTDFRKTQCSVYNVANKQQPSFINIPLGHDNKMADKEKFLGHKPEDKDNNFNSSNDVSDATKLVVEEVVESAVGGRVMKSIEHLNKSSSEMANNCDITNGNHQLKSSHTRARSDGGMIDLERGHMGTAHFPPRNLNKPTQPPPPPPPTV